jgi:hypothetical protein
MARKVFLSYQHRDEGRARGFDLLRRAPNLKVNYSVRHQMKRVNSKDPGYVGERIRSQMKGTSVTVVIIGAATAASDWVNKEIAWSTGKNPANGLLGIIIDPGATIPPGLLDSGAEVIDWTEPSDVHEFEGAIERAALAAARGPAIASSAGSGSSCGRG